MYITMIGNKVKPGFQNITPKTNTRKTIDRAGYLEFLIGTTGLFKRAAHLEYIPLPGGAKAIEAPWRMAAAYTRRRKINGQRRTSWNLVNIAGFV